MVESVALLSLHSSPRAPLGGSDAGGMNLYVWRLADELARLGIRADVFTRRTAPDTPEIERLEGGGRLIHLAAGPARQVPKSVLPMHVPALADALQRFIQREHRGYDVLHSHYWISGLTALRLREALGIPIVHMFHTLSKVKEFYTGSSDPTDSALRYDGERRVIEGVDAVVGATTMERDFMDRLYRRSPGRFTVIPPGVDMQVFRPRDRNASRRALGIEADRVILFVGRFDRIKGLDLLIRAVSQLVEGTDQRTKLVVVGGQELGTRDESSRYRHLVSRLGLDGVVRFCGIVPQMRLPVYYSAADVCAVPSAYESFGMVAVESMACGTPVVAFRVGGLGAIIEQGRTGFLASPGSASNFAGALRQALECDHLDAVARQARITARAYRWDAAARRTLDLYEEVDHLYSRRQQAVGQR